VKLFFQFWNVLWGMWSPD